MASDVVYGAVETLLANAWQRCPIVHENDSQGAPKNATVWIQIEMTGTAYAQQSLGAGNDPGDNRWDEAGILWGFVFVRFGSGSMEARQTAKAFADLFRGRLLLNDRLEFGDASIGGGQKSDQDGNWWGVAVSVEWRLIDADRSE